MGIISRIIQGSIKQTQLDVLERKLKNGEMQDEKLARQSIKKLKQVIKEIKNS